MRIRASMSREAADSDRQKEKKNRKRYMPNITIANSLLNLGVRMEKCDQRVAGVERA